MVRSIVCERNIYTTGESRSISFNANEPEKQTQQLWIQKVDANPRWGRTPLEQEQNAELKFSHKEEDDSRKPRSREKIALPSEEEAVTKRQRRGYSDYRHVETAAIKAFFRCLCIQFSSFVNA